MEQNESMFIYTPYPVPWALYIRLKQTFAAPAKPIIDAQFHAHSYPPKDEVFVCN